MSNRHLVLCIFGMAWLTALPAAAFQLKRDASGEVVRWANVPQFSIRAEAGQQLGEPRTIEAAAAAVEHLALSFVDFPVRLVDGGSGRVGYDFRAGAKNQNEIVVPSEWSYDPNAIAVTVITIDTKTHTILDADIAFNAVHHTFAVLDGKSPNPSAYDVQNTLSHELGHALGLAHNPDDATAVMFPSARAGEVHKRALTLDDKAGLMTLYPQALAVEASALSEEAAQGCNVAPRGGSAALALLAFAGLSLRRRARSRAAVLVAAGALSMSLPALASGRNAPAPADASAADIVATTRVIHRQTRVPDAAGLLVTTVTLEVRRCVKGACPKTISVELPGGKIGDIEQMVDGLHVPEEGQVLGMTLTPKPSGGGSRGRKLELFRLDRMLELSAFAQGLEKAGLKLVVDDG